MATASAILSQSTNLRVLSCSDSLLGNLRQAVTAQMMRVEVVQQAADDEMELPEMEAHHFDLDTGEDDFEEYDSSDYGKAILTPSRAAAAEGRDPKNPFNLGACWA